MLEPHLSQVTVNTKVIRRLFFEQFLPKLRAACSELDLHREGEIIALLQGVLGYMLAFTVATCHDGKSPEDPDNLDELCLRNSLLFVVEETRFYLNDPKERSIIDNVLSRLRKQP